MLSRYQQVVVRLRLAFLAILVLLFCALMITVILFDHLDDSQSLAIRESVPALAESQRLESLMAELLLLQSKIRSATTSAVTDDIADKLQILDSQIAISRNSIASSDTSRALSSIREELNQVILDYYPWLETRESINTGFSQLSEKRKKLSALSEQFLELTEPELIKIETALHERLQKRGIASSDDVESTNNRYIEDELSELVVIQNTLTEITFRFLAVIDEAIQLTRNTRSDAPEELLALISFNLKIATQRLTSLEDSDFRKVLAVMLRQLRGLIVASDGIERLLVTNADYQQQFDNAQNERAGVISSISEKIDDIVGDASKQVSESATIFERSLFLARLLLSIVALLIMGIVLLVIYFVIEKQINRRISMLTDAVLDIAKGDTSRSVTITGDDEIGRMANSLSVFKDTALALRSSNEDMEQFAYAAAHDLRSPLIAIENLAKWTIEDADGSLPGRCMENLELIVKRVRRLSVLQNDLLEYSRAGHIQDSIGEIRLDLLVKDIAELFEDQEEFTVVFSGHTEPVRTYVAPLQQILINLVNNSKKHHDAEAGVIEIHAELKGSVLFISVSDDGPGIAPKYQKRIFDMFTTLSAQDDVEGSGLGLALVYKLAHKHHGSIKVQSNPEQERGTRFTLEWSVF